MLRSTEAQRLRLVELEARILPILVVISVVFWVGLGLLALSYPAENVGITVFIGLWFMGFLVVSQLRAQRSSAPLVWLVGQEIGVIAILVYVMTWSGGVNSPALPMTVIIAMVVGMRFPARWTAAQVTVALVAIAGGLWLSDADGVRDAPVQTLAWLAAFALAASVTNMLARAERGARRDAVHDALTGLLNRAALHIRLEEAQAQPSRRAETLSVIAADLDGLKAVNDRFGHEAGDEVLRGVAASLGGSIREGDLLYRLGGDEFLVVLPATPTSEAAELAERLRATIAALRPAGHRVTLSAGVAGVVHEVVDLEHLIGRADRALYAAKDGGRDRVRIADPDPPLVGAALTDAHGRDLRADHSGRAPVDRLQP